MAKQAAKHGKGNGGMDILLVEDNPSYVELTVRALGEIAGDDLRVAVASTGERALEILLDRKRQLPRLVVLDLKLPGIGGKEVLRRLRSNPGTCHLPVVVLSSSSLPIDITESYSAGAYGYVVRPLNFKRYVDVLGDICAYWLVINVVAPADAVG